MFTTDDLAGVVDLFGVLTRQELEEALSELAYRRGEEVPEGIVDDALDGFALVAVEMPVRDGHDDRDRGAGEGGANVESEGVDTSDAEDDDAARDDDRAKNDDRDKNDDRAKNDDAVREDNAGTETVLAAGPTAFPSLPEGAEDLPHILDVSDRTVDRERVSRAAESRLRTEAAQAVAAGDDGRVGELLDVSYDLEAWGGVDLAGVRTRLDEARDVEQ